MQEPNENGVYHPEFTAELARRGRSYVEVGIAQCRDGLFHFALSIHCSDRGSGGPITERAEGFASASAAEEQALRQAIHYFRHDGHHEPAGIIREQADLRTQLEGKLLQPLLL